MPSPYTIQCNKLCIVQNSISKHSVMATRPTQVKQQKQQRYYYFCSILQARNQGGRGSVGSYEPPPPTRSRWSAWSVFIICIPQATVTILYCLTCTKFDKLILSNIIKTVATRCQILRLKFTKFDLGWGSAPDPAGGAYSAPPRSF